MYYWGDLLKLVIRIAVLRKQIIGNKVLKVINDEYCSFIVYILSSLSLDEW